MCQRLASPAPISAGEGRHGLKSHHSKGHSRRTHWMGLERRRFNWRGRSAEETTPGNTGPNGRRDGAPPYSHIACARSCAISIADRWTKGCWRFGSRPQLRCLRKRQPALPFNGKPLGYFTTERKGSPPASPSRSRRPSGASALQPLLASCRQQGPLASGSISSTSSTTVTMVPSKTGSGTVLFGVSTPLGAQDLSELDAF
jgi:hypothetical protein